MIEKGMTEKWIGSQLFGLTLAAAVMRLLTHISVSIPCGFSYDSRLPRITSENAPLRSVSHKLFVISLYLLLATTASPTLHPTQVPTPSPSNGIVPNIPTAEYNALKSFYDALGGDEWTWKSGNNYELLNRTWEWYNITQQAPPSPVIKELNISNFLIIERRNYSNSIPWNFSGDGVNNNNPCYDRWQGIDCICYTTTTGNNYCNINTIDLGNFHLVGQIPPAIGSFSLLNSLRLDRNDIKGELPPEICYLQNLRILTLRGNHVSGTIPHTIGNMSNLAVLWFYSNRLFGTIPHGMTMLSELRILTLSYNYLSGTLPSGFSNLQRLSSLQATEVGLTGPFPKELCSMQNLRLLFLNFNQFNGSIPDCIGNMTGLQNMNLDFNLFTHTIPSTIGQLKNMNGLYLAGNFLTGTLPESIRNLTGLDALVLTNNKLTGPLPQAFNSMKTLMAVFINLNYFSGPMPTYEGSAHKIRIIIQSDNLLTGTIPIECTVNRPLLVQLFTPKNQLTGTLPSFAEDFGLKYVDISENFLTGTLPSEIANSTQLNNLNYRQNYFTGTIPYQLGLLTGITHMYMNQNLLSGEIPGSLGKIADLRNLWLYSNLLSGTLSSDLGALSKVEQLYLQHNKLTGTLPHSLRGLRRLEQLFLYDNILSGPLTSVIDPNVQRNVTNLDFSNNQFTGVLPADVFTIPTLSSFAASTNCIRGNIPQDICAAPALTALAMDGLSTATSCQNLIFGHFAGNAYQLQNFFKGDVPDCLFAMPLLESLHLSGNGIKGSIGHDIMISHSLVDLALSHNILTGSIPLAIQTHRWSNLDLSFNKFSGELDPSFRYPGNSTIALQVNRLSGDIPESLTDAQNINMLDGNMFECSFDGHELPINDPKTETYECGSDAFNQASFLWIAIAGILGIIGLILVFSYRYKLSPVFEELPVCMWMREIAQKLLTWYSVFSEDVALNSDQTINIYNFGQFSKSLRKICVLLTAFMVLVLLPIDIALTYYGKTYTNEYAWTASSVYLSGQNQGIVLMVAFVALIALTIYIFDRYVFNSQNSFVDALTRNKNDNSKVPSFFSSYNIGQYVSLSAVAVLNLAVILPIDMTYVYIVLNYELTVVASTQLCLAMFKIFWNDIALRRILHFTRRLYFKQTTGVSDPQLSAELNKQRVVRDVLFLVYVVLVNNIAVPCLAIASISSDCFYNVIEAAPAVHTSYFYNQCVQDHIAAYTGYACVVFSRVSQGITYEPPFIYSYQCSSVFATNYATIYVYTFILVGFVMPALKSLAVMVRDRCSADSAAYRMINSAVPVNLRPLAVIVPTPIPEYFERQRFIVKANNYLAILLTFGVMCPPLGVVICISILAFTYYEQIAMGRLLTQVREGQGSLDEYRHIIDGEFADVAESFEHSVWIIVPFASLFYAYFVFDTLGDDIGGQQAIWAAGVMLCVPVLVYAIVRGKACYKARKMTYEMSEVLSTRLPMYMGRESEMVPHNRVTYMGGKSDTEQRQKESTDVVKDSSAKHDQKSADISSSPLHMHNSNNIITAGKSVSDTVSHSVLDTSSFEMVSLPSVHDKKVEKETTTASLQRTVGTFEVGE